MTVFHNTFHGIYHLTRTILEGHNTVSLQFVVDSEKGGKGKCDTGMNFGRYRHAVCRMQI